MDPDAPPAETNALYESARASCRQGEFERGIELAQQALAIDPKQGRAHNLVGLALSRLGRPAEALASFDAAITCEPAFVDAHGSRADVLAELGRAEEAIASYDRALAMAPDSAANWCNRGAALQDLRRSQEALASYERSLACDPAQLQVHFNRGNALSALARYPEALAAYEAALALAPDYVEAVYNRACLLAKLRRYIEAMACFEQVLALAPDHPRAVGELLSCTQMICDWDRAEQLVEKLRASVTDGHSIIPPHTLLGLGVAPADLLACNKRFAAQKFPEPAFIVEHRPGLRPGKLRLAYLSGEFRPHPVSYLIAGLFERHDRSRFEVIGVSSGADDGSDTRARILGSFDRVLDVTMLNDRDAAKLLRDLDIDILVDLTGPTENSRTGILAHRPAPIQVSYLGYLATMGADFVDYIIADRIALPFNQQRFYVEQIVHLPDCFMVGERQDLLRRMPSRAEAGLPEQGFVFCSFNHNYKFQRPGFDVWMRLLRAVDGSVLWLLGDNADAVNNLRREAQTRGVDPGRLIFAERVILAEHLARQRLADLFLDTLPYNAGATASAALWAGVPLLTCLGSSLVGRMAASMLHAIGLPELAVATLSDYEAQALALARDPARLQSLRARLEQNCLTHPLFDLDRLRRNLEAAYKTMWERRQRGEGPRGFEVSS